VDDAVVVMAKARQQMGLPILEITPFSRLYPTPTAAPQLLPLPGAIVDKACANDNGTQAAATLKAANALRASIKLLEEADPTNAQLPAMRKDLANKEAAVTKLGTKASAAQHHTNLQAALLEFGGQFKDVEEAWASAQAKSKETLQSHLAVANRYIEYFTNFKVQAIAAQAEMQKEFDAWHATKREHHEQCRLVFDERITKAEAALGSAALICPNVVKDDTHAMADTVEGKNAAKTTGQEGSSQAATDCIMVFNVVSEDAELDQLPRFEPDATQLVACAKLHYVLQQWEMGGCMHYFTFAQLNEWCGTTDSLAMLKEMLGPLWALWFGEQTTDSAVLPRQAVIFTAKATLELKSNYDASKLAENATQAKAHYASMKQRCRTDASPY
jgi:Skp family chaperone for outer membrane proteins